MQVEFKNRHLVQLYQEGESKKYPLPQGVISKFFMRIQQLEAAIDIHDLWKTPALNFEKLRGFENRYSLRLDRKWRLELEIDWNDVEKTKGTVSIIELSKHYEG